MKSKKGFTLLEICLVLGLCLAFMILPIQLFRTVNEQITIYRFFTEFEKNIKLYHQLSLVSTNKMEIKLYKNYALYLNVAQQYRLDYPKEVRLLSDGLIQIKFASFTGNSASFSSAPFKVSTGQTITYTFKIGKGNYEKTIR